MLVRGVLSGLLRRSDALSVLLGSLSLVAPLVERRTRSSTPNGRTLGCRRVGHRNELTRFSINVFGVQRAPTSPPRRCRSEPRGAPRACSWSQTSAGTHQPRSLGHRNELFCLDINSRCVQPRAGRATRRCPALLGVNSRRRSRSAERWPAPVAGSRWGRLRPLSRSRGSGLKP
jgi:hypothetical protein